jgi:hypothetical protein
MSPTTAENFIPTDLLNDDPSDDIIPPPSSHPGSSRLGHLALAYGTARSEHNQEPQSPRSFHSRSPSILSSPRGSLRQLHQFRDPLDDNQSSEAASSPFAGMSTDGNTANSRRISRLFDFSRQRGKTSLNESPVLGTLKQGESQSFPLDSDGPGESSTQGHRRNKGSGNWSSPMSTIWHRRAVDSGEASPMSRLGFARKSRRVTGASDLYSLDVSSPQRSSSYSIDNVLPRPSSESQPFPWGPDVARMRGSALGTDFSALGGPWSQNVSRRQSLHHGSASNLSIGTTPLDPDSVSTHTAPIGTGRAKARAFTPKLNPTAPSFTARLFGNKDGKKEAKGDKAGEKGKAKEKEKDKETDRKESVDLDNYPGDSSPQAHRVSKDGFSINTSTASMADSRDSLDRSPSSTPSEAANNSMPKESLMQRITRKSSSSKFSVPWSKDKTSVFSKKTGEPSTPS